MSVLLVSNELTYFETFSSCWNRHLCSDPRNPHKPRLQFHYRNAKKKGKIKINHWHKTRSWHSSVTKKQKWKKRVKINATFQRNYTRKLNLTTVWDVCFFFFLKFHTSGVVNARHVETPVTPAPHQEQNHSFTAMPGARITNKDTQHFRGMNTIPK